MTKRRKISRPLNLRPDEADDRDFPLLKIRPRFKARYAAGALSWKDEMTPIKDQGRKGSCVGFAVAAMKEWQERAEHLKELAAGKEDHRKGKVYDFSEQWIYHKCKEIDGWPGQEGTSVRDAMKVLHHVGCPPELGWPYDDLVTGEPENWAPMVAQWNTIDSYHRVSGSDGLIMGLQEGPVVIGVAVFNEFFYADYEGLIDMPTDPDDILGGHAICVVGYDQVEKTFEFKNSWNKTWGNEGYGKLHFAYVDQFMWDAWVAVDTAVEEIEEGEIPEIEEFKVETPVVKAPARRRAPVVKRDRPTVVRIGRRLLQIRK